MSYMSVATFRKKVKSRLGRKKDERTPVIILWLLNEVFRTSGSGNCSFGKKWTSTDMQRQLGYGDENE